MSTETEAALSCVCPLFKRRPQLCERLNSDPCNSCSGFTDYRLQYFSYMIAIADITVYLTVYAQT